MANREYDAQIREEIGSALRQSGFRANGPNESAFGKLLESSDFIPRADLERVDRACRPYSIGSQGRESFFGALYENTLAGKRIGNILGFLSGSLGTYLLTSGDGTLETAKNVAISSLVGLAVGKVSGIIGRRVGLKRGVNQVESCRYY